ncbi:unnamed protein product, partial [Discosporangium mesarthrocarpum]
GGTAGEALLALIIGRAADKAPTIRSKASSALYDIVIAASTSTACPPALRHAVIKSAGWGTYEPDQQSRVGTRAGHKDGRKPQNPLLRVIRARVQDEKAGVRRYAVPALERLLSLSPALSSKDGGLGAGEGQEGIEVGPGPGLGLGPGEMHAEDFQLLEERCNDISLATRKAAMTALSRLLQSRPKDTLLQEMWVRAVLPLAGDPEQTCQLHLVEHVQSLMFDRLIDWHEAMMLAGKWPRGDSGHRIRASRRGPGAPAEEGPTGAGGGGVGLDSLGGQEFFSAWTLLDRACRGEAHKFLKKV